MVLRMRFNLIKKKMNWFPGSSLSYKSIDLQLYVEMDYSFGLYLNKSCFGQFLTECSILPII